MPCKGGHKKKTAQKILVVSGNNKKQLKFVWDMFSIVYSTAIRYPLIFQSWLRTFCWGVGGGRGGRKSFTAGATK